MASSSFVTILMFALVLPAVFGTNSTSKGKKCSPRVLGFEKIDSKSNGCFGDSASVSWLSTGRWHVWYMPYFHPLAYACRELVSVQFLASNGNTAIYHRPAVKPAFFQRTYPELVRAWNSGEPWRSKWPCHKVSATIYSASGPRRREFIKQLKRIKTGILKMRESRPCGKIKRGPKSRKEIIQKERLLTRALTYIESVAFNNDLCI